MKIKIVINAIFAQCILYYFGYFLQLIPELLFILFTINTLIVIKEMFLNIMIMFIKQQFNINIKNRSYYFYNDIINLKTFDARLLKIDKKSFKGIDIYYIGYITKKKMMIVKIFIV